MGCHHHKDVIMSAMASEITNLTIVYSTVDSRRRLKKTSKLRVTGLCEWNSPVAGNSPHKGPVTRKMFPFDDVIMFDRCQATTWTSPNVLSVRRSKRISVKLDRNTQIFIQRNVFQNVICQLLSGLFRSQYVNHVLSVVFIFCFIECMDD